MNWSSKYYRKDESLLMNLSKVESPVGGHVDIVVGDVTHVWRNGCNVLVSGVRVTSVQTVWTHDNAAQTTQATRRSLW